MVALNESISGLTEVGIDIGGMITGLFNALLPIVIVVMILGAIVGLIIAGGKMLLKAVGGKKY